MIVTQASGMLLTFLLVSAFRRTARLPGLPKATARFWASTARAVCAYGVGMAVDLASMLSHSAFGTPAAKLGVELIFPIAGLLTLIAMYQYPTTARTRGERITVGMDASIVLLGSAAFIWYFSVSLNWTPDAGWLALLNALIQPVLTLVSGFAVLKIAFVGASVISRPTLVCFGASIAIGAVTTSVPNQGIAFDALTSAMSMISPLTALAGGYIQYKISTRGNRPERRLGRRRTFSVLPYCASAAAFSLLVIVLEPSLGWRQWGVLGGIGLLLCVVGARQFVALRENRRLLASNHELTAQLRRQAWFDELTGLANRAHYGERIGQALQRCRRDGTHAALLLIDLDDFKAVNDALGHAAGDALLREVARRLIDQVRASDMVCRLGGDEFVVIAEDTDEAAATALAERLVQAIIEPVHVGEHTVGVGASIGITLTDGAVEDPGEILRIADVAMYAAKAAGKRVWHLANQTATPQPASAAASPDASSPGSLGHVEHQSAVPAGTGRLGRSA
jgi:diguanylate cyclase (GGDEF)-like protein